MHEIVLSEPLALNSVKSAPSARTWRDAKRERREKVLARLSIEQIEHLGEAFRHVMVNRCAMNVRDGDDNIEGWRRRMRKAILADIDVVAELFVGCRYPCRYELGDLVATDNDDEISVVVGKLAGTPLFWSPLHGLSVAFGITIKKKIRKASLKELTAACSALDQAQPLDQDDKLLSAGDFIEDEGNGSGRVIKTLGHAIAYRLVGGDWHGEIHVVNASQCRFIKVPVFAKERVKVERLPTILLKEVA